MKKTILCLAVVSGFALGSSLAHAEAMGRGEPMHDDMPGGQMSGGQMRDQMVDRHFKEMDTNGDGMVSKAEFDAAHDRHFRDMDANGDGKLSPDEMKAGHQEMMKEGMKPR